MNRAGSFIRNLKLPGDCISAEDIATKSWPHAVGKRLALRTRAVAMMGHCLIVEVEDVMWQRQLNPLRGQILRKLEQTIGQKLVGNIDFRVVPPRRLPQPARLPADGRTRPQTGTAAGLPLQGPDEANDIRDPVLRRLYKAARKKASA